MIPRAGAAGTAHSKTNLYDQGDTVHHQPADCDLVHEPGDFTEVHKLSDAQAEVVGILGWTPRMTPCQWRAVEQLAERIHRPVVPQQRGVTRGVAA